MIRYARWAAVSTDSQASPDKISIDIQLEKAHAAASSRGWVETAGPYIASGESRTRFVSLRDAEEQIPQLKELLNAAGRHEFDVLLCYDLNRFRSLMRQVFDVLCDYNIQLYVLNNPREPVAPENYNDDIKAAVGMLVDMGGIISQSEISSLRRHYREKMPNRITAKGLHAGTGPPPYGYTKSASDKLNPNAVLIQDPLTAQVVIEIKDLYLKGLSITAVAKTLNNKQIPSPKGGKWVHASVAYILRNPFYAGITSWGKIRVQRDRRTGGRKYIPNHPAMSQGKHEPLWTLATHQLIKDQLTKRGKPHPGERTMQLSRLLRCHCGKLLWARRQPAYTKVDDFLWYCSSESKGHTRIANSEIYPQVIRTIIKTLGSLKNIKLPKPANKQPALENQIHELEHRKMRWVNAFEAGEIDARDYNARTASLTAQIDTKQLELSDLENTRLKDQTRRDQLTQLAKAIDSLEPYLTQSPADQVNARLRSLIERIDITKTGKPKITWY